MKAKLDEAEATAAKAQSVRKRLIGAKAKITAINAFRKQVDEIEAQPVEANQKWGLLRNVISAVSADVSYRKSQLQTEAKEAKEQAEKEKEATISMTAAASALKF